MSNNRLAYDKRDDGHTISTIRSSDGWYGKYETAIGYSDGRANPWKIAEGYYTAEEALLGHEKYLNMSSEELDKLSNATMTEEGENSINKLKEMFKKRLGLE